MLCDCSRISRQAQRSSSSLTSTASSSTLRINSSVRLAGRLVATPSAHVAASAVSCHCPVFQDWLTAIAPSACTPMTFVFGPRSRDNPRAAHAAPQADRHEDHVRRIGKPIENLDAHRADSGDQFRLVGRMHVTAAAGRRDFFEIVASFVEVAAVLDQLGPEESNGPILSRVVSFRNDDRAADAETSGRECQRLPMIARRAGDNARLAFRRRKSAHQVDPTADLERAVGW